jgi:UDP-2,3-diacylglucosamine hydrolase
MVDMDIVTPVMIAHMQERGVDTVIHGHIHRPGHTVHRSCEKDYQQYVLSDWDDNPSLLCYDNPNGFYFDRLIGE